MNKKLLIGSIIAVVILVLVSFTGVVGYQTTKSSTIARASPLFNIRTSRAIGEESKDVACDYVGKGEVSVLSIPKRDDRTVLQQKFIERISKMNDKTFNRFIDLVINHLKQKGHTDIDNTEIVNTLNQLRTPQINDIISLVNLDKPQAYTEFLFCTFLFGWKPGCLPFLIAYTITGMLNAIALLFFTFVIFFWPTVCIVPGTCPTI